MEVLNSIAPIAIIIGVFYLLVWKPQLDEQKRHKALIESLTRDDEVVLESGVYGRVAKLEDEVVELEVAKGVKVRVDRNKVARRASEPAPTKNT